MEDIDDELSLRFMTFDYGLKPTYEYSLHTQIQTDRSKKNESKVYFNLRLRIRVASFSICK